jgi:glycosyltransferase involved in cell wall biosynthesis
MIRVLFVEASAGGVVGGSLTGLYHLIRGLDRTRFEPIMVLYERKAIEADLAHLGVRVHHIRRRRIPKEHPLIGNEAYAQAKRARAVRASLRAARQTLRLLVEEAPAAAALARVIRAEQPAVVHLGNGLRANFDGVLAGLGCGTPVVCHVKGFEKYGARERWAARRTRTLVCMTRAIRDHCQATGVVAPDTRVVYDAVDAAWLTPRRPAAAVRDALGLPTDASCLGVVGNIQEWKGQRVFVEAFAAVAAEFPAAHGLLVGGVHRAGETYARDLRARVQALGLEGRVHCIGFRADVVDVMNALDIVVHASVRPEPFGRVILEGMLLGKPVVATAAGGVPELIRDGETGFLVPPGDAAALAETLRRLLSDAATARAVAVRARQWAEREFSLARQVAEMSAIYETAARTDRA